MVQNSWSEYSISAWPLCIWALRRCSTGTVHCHVGSAALSSSMYFTQWQHLEEINRHLLYPREGTQSKMRISELPAICVYLEEMEFIFSVRIWCKSSVGKCIELSRLLDTQCSWKCRVKYYFMCICFGRGEVCFFSWLCKWNGIFKLLVQGSQDLNICVWCGGGKGRKCINTTFKYGKLRKQKFGRVTL